MPDIVAPLEYPRIGRDADGNAVIRSGTSEQTPGIDINGALLTRTIMRLLDQRDNATNVGAAPSTSGLDCSITRLGRLVWLDFTFTALSITVTDAAGSGSYGATKIFDFVEQALSFQGCRQDYTAFAEGAALTTAAGDAVFEIGIGTTAISAAADGVLATANDNVGNDVDVTLSSGTGTGTSVTGAVVAGVNGTGTASDLYLNWSGTAATIDATSTIAVTGTATVLVAMLGDD